MLTASHTSCSVLSEVGARRAQPRLGSGQRGLHDRAVAQAAAESTRRLAARLVDEGLDRRARDTQRERREARAEDGRRRKEVQRTPARAEPRAFSQSAWSSGTNRSSIANWLLPVPRKPLTCQMSTISTSSRGTSIDRSSWLTAGGPLRVAVGVVELADGEHPGGVQTAAGEHPAAGDAVAAARSPARGRAGWPRPGRWRARCPDPRRPRLATSPAGHRRRTCPGRRPGPRTRRCWRPPAPAPRPPARRSAGRARRRRPRRA